MRSRKVGMAIVAVAVLGTCSVGWWAWTQEGPQDEAPPIHVLSCEVQESQAIRLAPATVVYADASGAVARSAVRMERQDCVVRALIGGAETRTMWEGRVLCYALVPVSARCGWAHFICALAPAEARPEGSWVWPGDEVHLFSSGPQQRLLAGSGRTPWVADVSATNTRSDALAELLRRIDSATGGLRPAPPDLMQGRPIPFGSASVAFVPAVRLLGGHRLAFAGEPCRIRINEVTADQAGRLVVTVTGARDDQRYELAFDGHDWRLE